MDPDPAILLLDEPTIGVDVAARPEIYAQTIRMAENGTSVIVVSSEMEELLLLCTRIGVVKRGKIVQWVNRAEIANEDELHKLIQVSL
jgi:ribose transport system ATP-binding protein